MTRTRASWRLVFSTYPCPTCGAKPGEDCVTDGGKTAQYVHAARTRNGNRCPRCGSIVSAEDEPGALCSKCALLRQLEIERATHWRRRNL